MTNTLQAAEERAMRDIAAIERIDPRDRTKGDWKALALGLALVNRHLKVSHAEVRAKIGGGIFHGQGSKA